MNEVVDVYYLRKPDVKTERTSRFIACHIKFGGDGGMSRAPMSIWVVDAWGNKNFLPLTNLGNNYDAWLISDLLQGHMKKCTVSQYINARIKAMKGDK